MARAQIQMKVSRALSIRQPWASLIVQGLKTIEVRSWPTKHRGQLWIHAGKTVDKQAMTHFSLDPASMVRGAVIAYCDLYDCRRFNSSTWNSESNGHLNLGSFESPKFGWYIRSVVPVDPVEMNGRLGLMKLDTQLFRELE